MKKPLTAGLLLLMLCLSGCSGHQQETAEAEPITSNWVDNIEIRYVSGGNESSTTETDLVKKTVSPKVTAPDGSITFKEACALLDTCSMDDFDVPQSIKEYQKFYYGTTEHDGKAYYSLYLYLNGEGNKKIFVGSNALVACDGSEIRVRTLMNDLIPVELNGAGADIPFKTRYPDAVVSPNEALLLLAAKEDRLHLDYGLEDYLFLIETEQEEINGLPCYSVRPRLECTDHNLLVKGFYLSASGPASIFAQDPESNGEHKVLYSAAN